MVDEWLGDLRSKAFTVFSRPSTVERARFRASCWFRHPSSMAWNTCSSGRSSGTPSAT